MEILILQALFTLLIIYVSILNVGNYVLTKSEFFSMISISTIFTVILCLNPKLEGFAMILVLFFAVIFLFWKTRNILPSITFSVLGIIIFFASDQFALYISISLLMTSPVSIRTDLFQICVHYSIGGTITYLISRFVGHVIHRGVKNVSLYLNKKQIAYFLFGLLAVLAFFYYQIFIAPTIVDPKISTVISSTISMGFLCFLIYAFVMFITGLTKSIESTHKQESTLQQQGYITSLETMSSEMKQFRHDHTNIISALYGFIEADDLPGLEKYFTSTIVPLSQKFEGNNNALDHLKNIRIFELKGLLGLKLIQAQEKGIQVRVEVPNIIESIPFNIFELTKVVGILIDNAVEACVDRENPVLQFALLKNGRTTTMLIVNSVHEPLPPISEMSKKGFSTKGKNRGLGLHTVHEIMDPCKNATISTHAKTNEFTQELKFQDE